MKKMNAHEAVMAFAGWLTSSKPAVTFSTAHDASSPCELVKDFAASQELPDIRDDFDERIKPYPARDLESDNPAQ